MAAADLQLKALRKLAERSGASAGRTHGRADAVADALQAMRERVNADIDAALANLDEMRAELAAVVTDCALAPAKPPADRRARRTSRASPPPHAEAPAPERRVRDVKRAAANDLDELPFEDPGEPRHDRRRA